jgi:glycosyltransferase involved in cell wall biosynthesis
MEPSPERSLLIDRSPEDVHLVAAAPSTVALSAVLPVFEERDSIPEVVDELERTLVATGLPYEIILIDDGSKDGSGEWIRDASLHRHGIVGVHLARQSGQSAALVAGLRVARGEVVVTLDADGQNDPADIPRLLDRLRDADVVSGVRAKRQDSWVRRRSSRIANAVRRRVLGDTLTDIGCSLKAYRRSTLEGLPVFVGVHRFLPALCQFRGARVVEVPVNHRPRVRGISKYGVGNRLARGIHDLVGVLWLRARLLNYQIREVTHE